MAENISQREQILGMLAFSIFFILSPFIFIMFAVIAVVWTVIDRIWCYHGSYEYIKKGEKK